MNQRLAGIILTFASQGVNIIVMLAYTPFLLRILGQSEYGLYQLAQSVIAALGMLSLGFSGAYVRFFTRFAISNDKPGLAKLNGMFMTVFLLMAAVALCLGGFLIYYTPMLLHTSATAHEIEITRLLMLVMTVNMALSFPQSVFTCNLIAYENFRFQRGLALFSSILRPLLTIPFLLNQYGSVSIVSVDLLLNLGFFLISWYYSIKENNIKFNFYSFPLSLLKEVSVFSFWIFLNFITDQINWNAGRFILGKFIGPNAVAVFAIGALINSLYLNLSVAVSSVYVPFVNRIVEERRGDQALTDLFIRIGRSQFFVLFYILGGFILLGQYFIQLWAGAAYHNAYWVALLLIMPVTIPLIQNIGIDIMKAKNMHKFRSIVYITGSVLNIIISICLVTVWHEIGVAAGTCVALVMCNIFIINWYYHKKVGLNIVKFWKNIGGLFFKTVLPIILCLCIARVYPVCSLSTFLLYGVCYTVFYISILYFIGFNSDEKNLVRSHLIFKEK